MENHGKHARPDPLRNLVVIRASGPVSALRNVPRFLRSARAGAARARAPRAAVIPIAFLLCASPAWSSLNAADTHPLAAAAEEAKAPALDGKTFVGEMGEKGKPEKVEKDTFIFKDGTFRSTGCDAYGFTATRYAARAKDGALVFEAVATSPQEGKMRWKGIVRGEKIEGKATWEKEGQKPTEFWFKGTLTK